jgi:hypothetical protein
MRIAPAASVWFAFAALALSSACAPPPDVPAPLETGGPRVPVHADVTPLLGNAPLRVTVTSSLGAFSSDECDVRVLGVPTGADLNQEVVQVEVDVTSSVALVCERGVSVGVDEHLVDLSSIDSFTASPPLLVPGAPLTLAWSGHNLGACDVTADGGKSPVTVDELGARASHIPSASTTYTLTCEGLGGPITRTLSVDELTVRVAAPPYVSYGDDLILTLGVDARASCNITAEPALPFDAPSGPVDGDVRRMLIPNVDAPRMYIATCTLGSASAQATTPVIDVAPRVRKLDVTAVTASSITLAWEAVGASACTLDNGGAPLAIESAATATNPFDVETGTVTYRVHCATPTGLQAELRTLVAWGDVVSAPALFGVRAVTGDVLLEGALPSGALRFDDVKFIAGDFTVRDAALPDALVFVGLAEVGGAVSFVDLPLVSRLLFPELARAQSLNIREVPSLTCADVAPVVCALDAKVPLDVTPSCPCAGG